MAYFSRTDLREFAKTQSTVHQRSVNDVLNDSRILKFTDKQYDIFLSHSFLDKEEVAGLTAALNDLGHSVYVDWIEDHHLQRDQVNQATAELLRQRMKHCKCLFYATSQAAGNSRWMPWELGYMDGLRNKCAVVPILEDSFTSREFTRQEYLTLYPAIERLNGKIKVVADDGTSLSLDAWLLEDGRSTRRYFRI